MSKIEFNTSLNKLYHDAAVSNKAFQKAPAAIVNDDIDQAIRTLQNSSFKEITGDLDKKIVSKLDKLKMVESRDVFLQKIQKIQQLANERSARIETLQAENSHKQPEVTKDMNKVIDIGSYQKLKHISGEKIEGDFSKLKSAYSKSIEKNVALQLEDNVIELDGITKLLKYKDINTALMKITDLTQKTGISVIKKLTLEQRFHEQDVD